MLNLEATKIIEEGLGTLLPLVYLNTCSPLTTTYFALSPSIPSLPLYALTQLNTLIKLLPSIVIGMLNEPLSANSNPFVSITIVAPFLVIVSPCGFVIVPIVGVFSFEP